MAGLLTARVAANAKSAPASVALVDGKERTSYGELVQAAGALAQTLKQAGLARGARVALLLPNSLPAVVGTYGAWLAGGVVVPLNVQARARDFVPWLQHCDPEAVIFDAANADAVAALQQVPQVHCRIAVGQIGADAPYTSWSHAVSAAAPGVPIEAVCADGLAMVLYTSGTTGRPKGVTLTHGNFASNIHSIEQYLSLTARDSIVSILPFYYSYGASVLHSHLAVGATVVLQQNLVFPHLVIDVVEQERVSGFCGVPSTYSLLLSRVDFSRYDLSSLRYLTQAGGAMPVSVIQKLQNTLPNARLFVMYGQTEATARLTYLDPARLTDKLGSVGQPIPGVVIEIRDAQGLRAAALETGEVWAQGANIMRGYWRDPQATAEVLIDGWLKTGDMGYLDQDGFLYLVGRRSDIIKTGAHRVYPKDIEEAILECSGVEEVAVIGVDDEVLGQAIKAFVVATPGGDADERRIKAHCREQLAQYKVPKFVVFVEDLPKTSSGKIRRQALSSMRQE